MEIREFIYEDMKKKWLREEFVPHLDHALLLLRLSKNGISFIEENKNDLKIRCQSNGGNVNTNSITDKPLTRIGRIIKEYPGVNFPEYMNFKFDFDCDHKFKLILNIPSSQKLMFDISDERFQTLVSRGDTNSTWNFTMSRKQESEKYDLKSADGKRTWIMEQLLPCLESVLLKLLQFLGHEIYFIEESVDECKNTCLKVKLIRRPEESEHKCYFKLLKNNLDFSETIHINVSIKAELSESIEQYDTAPPPNVPNSEQPDLVEVSHEISQPDGNTKSQENTSSSSKTLDQFKIKFQFGPESQHDLTLLIPTGMFKGFQFKCRKFEKRIKRIPRIPPSNNKEEWQITISRTDSTHSWANEEWTKCYYLLGNTPKITYLPVITIRSVESYHKEIFVRNLAGPSKEHSIKLIQYGVFISEFDLLDFYIYGIVAIVYPVPWPWINSNGEYCEPPFNADTQYNHLCQDINSRTTLCFANASRGNFCDPSLSSISKRDSQFTLALVYAEPIRNLKTLEFNRMISQHRLLLLDIPKFLYNHPMVLKGTFQGKKTKVGGNKVSNDQWKHCQKLLQERSRYVAALILIHILPRKKLKLEVADNTITPTTT